MRTASMQNPRPFFLLKVVFRQTAGHLHTDIEHGLGHFDMLSLKVGIGTFFELHHHKRLLILCAAQGNAPVGQLDNFQE